MSVREPTPGEADNIAVLQERTGKFAYLVPTSTGMQKSIMDAVGPLRSLLQEAGLHDYELQGQGPEHRTHLPTRLFSEGQQATTTSSLYRPVTKNGDPRIWISQLPRYAEPWDLLAVLPMERELVVINLTRVELADDVKAGRQTELVLLLDALRALDHAVADELLEMLQDLGTRGPVPARGYGDTAVGRTLEAELGIAMNSSRNPDYRGIELKSFRQGLGNRKNLFAQVSDWTLSPARSSAGIVRRFGYEREDVLKLYVTVSATAPNPQGLQLRLMETLEQLHETSLAPDMPLVAVWPLALLHRRLAEKHRETFWVAALQSWESGREVFHFQSVLHTRSPIPAQFDLMIASGQITLDHLIKQTGAVVREKGPLFKVAPKALPMLFPPGHTHELLGQIATRANS